MNNVPKISVIIPAFNEERFLPRALASLRRAADFYRRERGEAVEFIVVDNNSTDRTAAVARESGADRVVFEPVNNIARTRNAGAHEARGEWLAFCDADNEVTENMFVVIHDNLSNPTLIGGGTLVRPEKFNVTVAVYFTIWKLFSLFGRVGVGVIHCRREHFQKMGGFDTNLFAGEDVQFVFDLRKLGKSIGCAQFVVRQDAAIITSMRKTEDFGFWFITWRMVRMLFGLQRKIRDKRYCDLWYDVKRG